MPAYPFVQSPTFEEFKTTLEQHDCQFKSKEIIKNNKPFIIFYFERIIDGKTLHSVITKYNENERITPTIIRSNCNILQIDPSIFGLHLG